MFATQNDGCFPSFPSNLQSSMTDYLNWSLALSECQYQHYYSAIVVTQHYIRWCSLSLGCFNSLFKALLFHHLTTSFISMQCLFLSYWVHLASAPVMCHWFVYFWVTHHQLLIAPCMLSYLDSTCCLWCFWFSIRFVLFFSPSRGETAKELCFVGGLTSYKQAIYFNTIDKALALSVWACLVYLRGR